MPLHLTKVAFGATSLDHLAERLEQRGAAGPVFLTTRYLPKRHVEIIGGSLFWIIKHQLIARSPILRFGEAEEGPQGKRVAIHIEPRVVLVEARPRRAHQGWRYLEGVDAPPDLGEGMLQGDMMPAALMGRLAGLGLI